jgi:putative ABC transport system permease protein
MEALITDLRYGVRGFLKRPGFAVIAIITLALGIGANTALFSVVYGVLLRPLPYANQDQLAMVWLKGVKEAGGEHTPLSVADLLDWRARNRTFQQVAAFNPNRYNYSSAQTPEEVTGARVTANFFATLDVPAMLGRTFLADEEKPDAQRAVIVSEHFWRTRLQADYNVVGRSINLSSLSYRIVGVMPSRFAFPSQETELWTAMQLEPPARRGPYFLRGLARLKPGVTFAQSRDDLRAVAASISGKEPKPDEGFNVVPLAESLVGDIKPALLLLFAAVTLVLLIASVNVANLSLARGAARVKELSVRAALGATRVRLARQLLTESLLLAIIGGAVSLPLAVWSIDLLVAMDPKDIPRLQEVSINWRVLAWTALISLASGLIFGVAPAFHSSKIGLSESLKEGGRSNSEGKGRRYLRDALVLTEVAFALTLLIGAGLLAKSFWLLRHVEPGIDQERLLTARISLPSSKYREENAQKTFFQQLLTNLSSEPGVRSAALSSGLPPDRSSYSDEFSVAGEAVPPDGKVPVADVILTTPAFFRTVGAALIGRDFNDGDKEGSAPVVIINQTLARRFFAGKDPLGKQINYGERPLQIVGVAGDVKYRGLSDEVWPTLYFPLWQRPFSSVYITVRSDIADPLALTASVRKQVAALDPELPLADVNTMKRMLSESVAEPRLHTSLILVFAGLALALAAVGIKGVMSYAVSQRTQEIGIRIALGARTSDVLKLVLKNGMTITLIGVVVGLAGAIALTRLMTTLLFGVTPTDATTFAAVSALLIFVALLACYIPARRATKVDPLVALRYE